MEAESARILAELRELFRRVVAAHRMMISGRRQVLSHREDVDSSLAQIRRSRDDLVFGFAEAEHDRRFGQHVDVPLFVRPSKDVERLPIFRHRTNLRIQPRHGLDVVRKYFGCRSNYGSQRVAVSFEIGDEHFDRGTGPLANGEDRRCDMRRAAIRHVIAIHHRDDRVFHAHRLDRFRNAARLIAISDKRLSFADRAERAAARADLAEDHEGRGAGVPAFEDVRATRFLTNGV